ncbi:mediator of RNA polymerase II transcription subunit 13 isoform X2 [Anthonomus grandis grandis]|uniref:mediator of RNA polymerase II transcription subunit 13 isoform X2 n=1 Tax=Anthonomus grandis grandis TaxID=2921223 RepID=UPI002165EC90|nr:mediator of RNA polymerase II transcription subunit 13 isoform X2 [Anthonomus grandis grandis]
MTHPNFQTNGASLEDCHTNFFALTELSGIKWRKLTWSEPGGGSHGPGGHHHHAVPPGEPLDDPVLRSYARCLAADILCVWRRVSGASRPPADAFEPPPPPAQPPPLSLASAKELWIFWYGEEPDLNELVAPELNTSDCEQGSWESGLSYECRSLLFKALHNLIERCLLSRDFIRLGKWFVQPYDYPAPRYDPTDPENQPGITQEAYAVPPPTAGHLSFSFAFFVHGESSVCASVDVRQHPPVRRLTRWHMQEAQASTGGIKVILAPFGLAGTLTGQSFRSPESTAKFLDDWSHFYPLDKSSSLTDSSVVEVIVGGAKMRYPSCYVLVTDLDDNANQMLGCTTTITNANLLSSPNERLPKSTSNRTISPLTVPTPPPSPIQVNSRVPQPGPHTVSVENINNLSKDQTAAQVLSERTWQQCLCGGDKGSKEEGSWEFVEPTRKVNCSCVKPRKYLSSSKWITSSNSLGAPPGSTSPRPQKSSKSRVPFHRRSPTPKSETSRPKTSQTSGGSQPQNQDSRTCLGGSYTPQGGPPSYPRTQESMIVNSVGSPASVAPSPLQGPHSQPASVPPADATMPTLSPNPPIDQSPSVGGDKSHTPPDSVKVPPKSVESPLNSPAGAKGDQESKIGDRRAAEDPDKINLLSLKRPQLSSKEYEVALGEEEHTLDMLYDYSTQDAWLNHPVKRFKPDENENKFNKKLDLYTMYHHNGIGQCNDISSANPVIKTEIKQEPMSESDLATKPLLQPLPPHGVKRPGDPYEFEEAENPNVNNCKTDNFARNVPIKEEPKDKKDNLFTSEGLQPSYKDLDQIFDNSDYTSSDEAIQIQTPPGSAGPTNHHVIHHDGDPVAASATAKRLSGHGGQTNLGGCPSVGIPPELSKMFPTPPSLEHNPIASPCGQMDLVQPDFNDLTVVRVKQEIYPMMGSPQEENIEDWSYVFKPPPACKLVGSSKYAPLTNLPSQVQPIPLPPNCVYKPSWVQHMENNKNLRENTNSGSSNANPLTSNRNRAPTPSIPNNVHQTAGIFPASPLHPHPPGFRPPPPPYELPSPANSTTSSYLNKNINSVEPVPTPQPHHRTPEASSLVLNILLTDTAFNIFRDHNFDSCTLCVCNAGPKVVGNIRGADSGIYLLNSHSDKLHASAQPTSPYPGMGGQPPPYGGGMMSPQQQQHHVGGMDEDQIRCSCGFSAVVNRRLAYGSGLFYEDEMEITGIAEDPGERKKSSLVSLLTSLSCLKPDTTIDRDQLDNLPHYLLDMIRDQLVFVPSTANALCRAARYVKQARTGVYANPIHVLEYADSNEVTTIALEQSKSLLDNLGMCKLDHDKQTKSSASVGVHRWPYLRAPGPQCNQDVVRVMKCLQPLLQDAIQKKCQTRLWEAPSAVKGPLTWRQFHRLAGRGTDDRCEPQPIPSVIVGHDKDWLCLSPYALQQWESLMLEPYSYSRDVAYVVVAPDNDAILPRVKTFFKELSTAYEICKLGRHSPITKILRDGILRVGKKSKMKIGNEPVEEWFTLLGEGEASDMLKLYAQVCKHHLAPHLQQVPMDKTLLDPPVDSNAVERPAPSPMPPPNTPDPSSVGPQSVGPPDKQPSTPKSDQDGDGVKDTTSFPSSNLDPNHDDDEREAPSVVVYLIEPFTLGSNHPDMQRLAVLALMRCFQSVLTTLPENIRNNISVQIISLESIVELNKSREMMRHSDQMRALALNIFSQCRRLLIHSNNVKSLTGFGTAATADLFLKNKDENNRIPYRLYTPPYILAPMREKVEAAEAFGKGAQDQSSVLYVSYCLSEDQSWLLGVCTDGRGEIYETVTINIDIPNRSRRKKASARRIGLEKLMTFILGVMSQSVRPWRLVVGRLGRIGHGELKGWSWLLSKKNLLKASRHLKEICNQCSMLYPSAVPCILSACLVSLEPDSCLRLMPDQFTPDERFSQASVNSQLSTPQDVSCTHILVFPTSATTQSSQTAFQETHISGDLGDDELFKAFDDDMTEGMDNEFNDIFNWDQIGCQSPTGSPRREDAVGGSPGGGVSGGMDGGPGLPSGAPKGQEPSEEVGVVLQQPLALGYLVSTAPTGRMPRWFWTACPHLEGVCPAFLKNALHLHSPNIQQSSDDLFQQNAQVSSHPLDSQYTTDVLRYVLEGYNALSWLALDPNTKDRLSCLPIHIQVLVQLYHTAAALL